MKRAIPVLIFVLVVAAILIGAVVFYAIPFGKTNGLIVQVNSGGATPAYDWVDDETVSGLRVRNETPIGEGETIQVRSQPRISVSGWDRIEVEYTITVTVIDQASGSKRGEETGVCRVAFVFDPWTWTVTRAVDEETGNETSAQSATKEVGA